MPPFAGWVKRIIITCTAIFLLELVARRVFHIDLGWVDEWFALIPVFVMKGEIWQLVTYSLLHASFSHLFFNMLTLWFIGAYLESDWGSHQPVYDRTDGVSARKGGKHTGKIFSELRNNTTRPASQTRRGYG